MPYVLLVVATCALGLLIYVLAGCGPSHRDGRAPAATTFAVKLPETPATRAELAARLERLAASPPPTELAPGAMCYDTAVAPLRTEYVCPTCGEKTLYAQSDAEGGAGRRVGAETLGVLRDGIEHYRREVERLASLSAALDESQLCKKCSPDVRDPEVVLVIAPPGATAPHRTAGVSPEDLRLLREFAAGADRHDLGPDGERPLKDYLPRIRELLGLPGKPTGKE